MRSSRAAVQISTMIAASTTYASGRLIQPAFGDRLAGKSCAAPKATPAPLLPTSAGIA